MENYMLYAEPGPLGPVKTGHIIRLKDKAVIPPDEGNVDYLAYLEWVSRGNSPLEPNLNIFNG